MPRERLAWKVGGSSLVDWMNRFSCRGLGNRPFILPARWNSRRISGGAMPGGLFRLFEPEQGGELAPDSHLYDFWFIGAERELAFSRK